MLVKVGTHCDAQGQAEGSQAWDRYPRRRLEWIRLEHMGGGRRNPSWLLSRVDSELALFDP